MSSGVHRQSSTHYVLDVHYRMYNQTHLLLRLLFDGSQGLGISEIVDGDSQEHIQEDICVAIFVKDRLKFIKSDRIDIASRKKGKEKLFRRRVIFMIKDTIAAYEEDNKINTGEDADTGDAVVSPDPVVHHSVPVLAG